MQILHLRRAPQLKLLSEHPVVAPTPGCPTGCRMDIKLFEKHVSIPNTVESGVPGPCRRRDTKTPSCLYSPLTQCMGKPSLSIPAALDSVPTQTQRISPSPEN